MTSLGRVDSGCPPELAVAASALTRGAVWGMIVGMMTRPHDTEPMSRTDLRRAIEAADAARHRRRRQEMKMKAALMFIDAARRAWWKIGVVCYVCTMLEINGPAAFHG